MEMEGTSSWVNIVHEQLSQANCEEDLLKLRPVVRQGNNFMYSNNKTSLTDCLQLRPRPTK